MKDENPEQYEIAQNEQNYATNLPFMMDEEQEKPEQQPEDREANRKEDKK